MMFMMFPKLLGVLLKNRDLGFKMKGLPEGTVASRKIELLTVDSGACDTIVPPEMFKHTPVDRHSEFGSKYRACGGEPSPTSDLNVLNVC